MSEYKCENGHILPASKALGRCAICKGKIIYCDELHHEHPVIKIYDYFDKNSLTNKP